MTSDLFPNEGRQDSPRLAWMKRHGVITKEYPAHGDWYAGLRSFAEDLQHVCDTDADILLWERCEHGLVNLGHARTEDDAIADLARKMGLRLWNEEGQAELAAHSAMHNPGMSRVL